MTDTRVAFTQPDGPEVASGTRQKLAKVFLERSIRALQRLSDAAPAEVLENALQAPTDVGGVAVLLPELAPLGLDLSAIDPLAEAIARSALVKQELLQEAGGAYTAMQASTILGISRQAVEQRRRRNKLLAVPLGTEERVYPVCQFTADGVLPGLEDVLAAFTVEDPWTQLSVLLGPAPSLGGRSVLEALRVGEVEGALRIAEGFGDQGY